MIFDCPNGVRPIRLSEETRKFAYESLHHKYGQDARRNPAVSMDHIENFDQLEAIDKYDLGIKEIAEKAPIRICAHEKLSGAATLGAAIDHQVPFTYKNEIVFSSVSHLTTDFEKVLTCGINGIEREIHESLQKKTNPEKVRFLQSCQNAVDAMAVWHGRYLEALKDQPAYGANYKNLQRVPFEPATSFYEAVQSIWFTFAFLRLCGNWPGIGRIDWLLGPYLKKDLARGAVTLEEAREILAHFFIKGCEWICGGESGSGDAQHYQNIVLAGIDGEGNEITNEVTYLVLDVIEELGISDFPTSVRLNSKTDSKLLNRAAEVLKLGGGVLAFYNEDAILASLAAYGYAKEEAWKFANDGCWEIQIPGKTWFSYIPFDALAVLQYNTLKGYDPQCRYDSFEDLYRQYRNDLETRVADIINGVKATCRPGEDGETPWVMNKHTPCSVVSLFEGGCIEKGVPYLEGGAVYNVVSPHIGGYPDAMNSLYAIKKLVFDEKKLSFEAFMDILAHNWEGHEDLRLFIRNHYDFFGNNNPEVDEIGARILKDFADICDKHGQNSGFKFPAGVSTFGRQLEWSHYRLASPHGYHHDDVLAPNCSPTPNTDKEGALAIVASYCKADLKRMVTGAALDIKLLPSSVSGEDGTAAIEGLLRGFVAMGGCFVQPDVVDKEVLKEAQLHPEDYQTLSVRVSGWNARFVTLCKEWQDMVIDGNK